MEIDPSCNLVVNVDKKRNARIFKWESSSREEVAQLMLVHINKWASSKDEFDGIRICNIFHNWEACLCAGSSKMPRMVDWTPLKEEILKFNVDGAAREKPRPAGIGVGLHNSLREVMVMFSKHVGMWVLWNPMRQRC